MGDGGSAITEGPDISVELARRTCACWMHNSRYQQDLYDQPKAQFSYYHIKTWMVKTEAIETSVSMQGIFLSRGTLHHHRVLLCITGAQIKRPNYRIISSIRALDITESESIETTV